MFKKPNYRPPVPVLFKKPVVPPWSLKHEIAALIRKLTPPDRRCNRCAGVKS